MWNTNNEWGEKRTVKSYRIIVSDKKSNKYPRILEVINKKEVSK